MKSMSMRQQVLILFCGSTVVLLSMGLRQNFGLYMDPISSSLGWGRETFAFAVALQSLVWGVSTPFFGWLSDKFGPAKVAAGGGALYAAGLFIMAQATSPMEATVGIGFMTGLASAMTSFPIVLSVIGRMATPERRSLYLGIASAAGSSGQLILVPAGQWVIAENGWVIAILFLAALAALIVPLSAALAGGNRAAIDQGVELSTREALSEAAGHRGFKLLVTGYFVCGFQTMFIGAHLPAYLTDLGHSAWLGATALALIGGFNVVGTLMWGHLGGMYAKKNCLAILYFLRAVCMAVFISLPITEVSVILFASSMGLLWLGTVPLTTGIVAQVFGTQYMATLVGITFVSHQIGSFLGIWLGGIVYDVSGNYDPIFWGGVFFGVMAALVHYPINEEPLARTAVSAA
jgi:MFS family permease